MFRQKEIEDILFLDIETACVVEDYHDLSPRMQGLWDKKSTKYARSDDDTTPEELFWQKGAIHAEFGRVVCISCGYLRFGENGIPEISIKSYVDPDEKTLLADFGAMLNKFTSKPGKKICAHNGKEFDFPFLGRRYIINQLQVPYVLQVQGKKPWETPFVDTMQLWKFGDYKSYTSLDLLTAVLDVPTSKDDIDGSMVSTVYWRDKDPERIKVYCEKDVLASAQVLLRMSGMPLVPQPEEEAEV